MNCERCAEPTFSSTMSRYNTETICLLCEREERGLPSYHAAARAEVAAVMRGDYNFPGVGLSTDDREALSELRAARDNTAPF